MRYLPLGDADRRAMLSTIGVGSVDEFYRDVPRNVFRSVTFDLPNGLGEIEVERAFTRLAAQNLPAGSVPCFLGGGAYRHHVPATVDHLIQRGEFLTAYTPYQPEASQGTLQALFEFQTQVALLASMEAANASLYDGATAVAEAAMMASRLTRRKKAILAGDLHPHYRDTTATYARFNGFAVVTRSPDPNAADDLAALVDNQTSCVIVQNPGAFGQVRDFGALAAACHRSGALLIIAVAEPVALGLVKPPGAMDADIFVGEGQGLGNALSFGGPYLGLMATREKFVRQMPGRLVGQATDADGRRGFVLTLAAREQHIRREKATSNICTNSSLCALAFAIHMALLGEAGFTRLAETNHARAAALADALTQIAGVALINDTFFNEFTLRLPEAAAPVVAALARRGILGGVPASRLWPERPELANLLLVAATETTADEDIAALAGALHEVLQ